MARLNLYSGILLGALEKYRYLPFILAKNQKIQNLLLGKGDTKEVSHYLEIVNEQAGSAALFVMNGEGLTICSSNWREKLSFVGKNYGFRPYFKQAMQGKSFGFFAIGVTTNRPGYFISSPVYGPNADKVIGVAVVKIDLTPLEKSWLEGGEMVLVGDQNGVIFLSSLASYKYQSFQPLSPKTMEKIVQEKQYHDVKITILPVKKAVSFSKDAFVLSDATYFLSSRKIPQFQWNVYYLASLGEAKQLIYGTVAIAVGSLFLLLFLFLFFRERRLKRISNRKARNAEALEAINKRLQLEIVEHSQTEKELRETQQEVLQAGKLAALGKMSAAVSHELNQPIAAIRTYAASCRKFYEKNRQEMAFEALDNINDLAEHMGSVTSQLKTFARKSDLVVEPVVLQDRITRVLYMLDNQIQHNGVLVCTGLCESQVTVAADPVRVDQVLVNLIKNAIDAMEQTQVKRLSITLSSDDGNAKLSVMDNGIGIAPELKEHLFEPFFTTKNVGEGVGLGLSISYGIVSEIGGSIEAKENENGGAVFVVSFPVKEIG